MKDLTNALMITLMALSTSCATLSDYSPLKVPDAFQKDIPRLDPNFKKNYDNVPEPYEKPTPKRKLIA